MKLNQVHGQGDRSQAPAVALAGVWPEIHDVIPAEDRGIAARVLVVPLLSGGGGRLTDLIAEAAPTAFDLLVAEGVVFKETTFADRTALELLGPGDVLAPTLAASRQLESRAVSRYVAHGRASVAVLDHRFTQAVRRWPGLYRLLHERLATQAHRASMHLATLHQPRAEDRIMSLFVDLAERFGRVTADGVIIDLELTHALVGRLIGSQRPTVSLALAILASRGALSRLDVGGWRLDPAAMTF